MAGVSQQIAITLRLYSRNTMGLVYGYLFPTIFLVAFWVLYRYDRVPLVRHVGELLTVTILGGACFGLPTTMVSERERGVWRRYRLTPVPTAALVTGTLVGRYVILITAGLLQLLLARVIGMPWPPHLAGLAIAFTCVSFAFLGVGLVIAALADNVPAVQALGQCIFLPMLIIGGVAVPLASLPPWAQHLSAFFPGRYAVEAIQACVTGSGLSAAGFEIVALLSIGIAGGLAGSLLFRWDAQQRFMARTGKSSVAFAVLAWVAVGVTAEAQGRILIVGSSDVQATPTVPTVRSPQPPALPSPQPAAPPSPQPAAPLSPQPLVPSSPSRNEIGPSGWRLVTMNDIEKDLVFDHLPPDSGVVTPIAGSNDLPDEDTSASLEAFKTALPDWKPGKVTDPVQRVRNYLYALGVIDVLELPIERFAPAIAFERIQREVPRETLIKVLYWIAVHPDQGDASAFSDMASLGLPNVPTDVEEVRGRAGVYAVKLLGRVIGRIPQR